MMKAILDGLVHGFLVNCVPTVDGAIPRKSIALKPEKIGITSTYKTQWTYFYGMAARHALKILCVTSGSSC
jgi:hypothetical protein